MSISFKKLEWVWGSLISKLTFGSGFLGWNLLEVCFFDGLFRLIFFESLPDLFKIGLKLMYINVLFKILLSTG